MAGADRASAVAQAKGGLAAAGAALQTLATQQPDVAANANVLAAKLLQTGSGLE